MLKSKFLIIFLIILVILFGFSGFSKASFDFSYNETIYSFPDLPEDVSKENFNLIMYDGTVYYLYSLTDRPYYDKKCTSFYDEYKTDCIHIGVISHRYEYAPDASSVWKKVGVGRDLHLSGILEPSQGYWYSLIYTNFDILDRSTQEVVFPSPALTLGEVLERTNPVKRFQITTSGMIISLVVFLVLLVGFLKAWYLLLNSLRKA